MEEKEIASIVQKCKKVLAGYYRTRLKGVILYGSRARGDATQDSDIDLLVLLSSPVDYFAELRQIVDLLYPIQLESEQLISAKPAPAKEYEMGSISLYRMRSGKGSRCRGSTSLRRHDRFARKTDRSRRYNQNLDPARLTFLTRA